MPVVLVGGQGWWWRVSGVGANRRGGGCLLYAKRRRRHRRSSALHGYHVTDYDVAQLSGGVVRDFEAVACACRHFSWALVIVYQ